MARLLVAAESCWYDELSLIASYYESEFEKTLRQHVNNVFPDYLTISYKIPVTARQRESRKPDLAMIRRNYNDWWLVEVELSDHPLQHVIEQVEVFTQGDFNSFTTAKYIIKQNKLENNDELDFDKVRELIKSQQPKVLVIVDEPRPEWDEELKKLNAKLCVFQVFKNTTGHEAYRLDGQYPEVVQAESHCSYPKSPPNMLEILNPKILEINENEEMDINYNGRISKWKRIDDRGSIYLKAIGKVNPVPANKTYVLFKDTQGRFVLKLN